MNLSLYIFLSVCMILTLLYLLTGEQDKKMPTASALLAWVVLVILGFSLGLYETDFHGDKWAYLNQFKLLKVDELQKVKDVGWFYYSYFIKQIGNSPRLYFVLTAMIYSGAYGLFAQKFFSPKYQWYFLIACMLSFGFAAYAVNTIRAGFALAFLLIAFRFHKKVWWFVLFAFLSISFHKSMILPVLAFSITYYLNQTSIFLTIWCSCLLLSVFDVFDFSNILIPILGDEDDRLRTYIELAKNESKRYQAGFRIDFVIYSVIPILIAAYYLFKLKVEDIFYQRMFNTYLLANAVWLLIIRMAFTDRVAFLSWFLIPFLLLYPLLKYKLPLQQRFWAFFILLGIYGFTSLMFFWG